MSLAARWKSRASADLRGVVEAHEADRRVDLVEVGRAQPREQHRLAADVRAPRDDAELRPQRAQRLRARGRRVAGRRLPRVDALEHLDRLAAAAEDVVHVVLAGRHRVGVDVVLARRGRAPRVVAPAAELDVEVEADERGAAGVDAGLAGRRGGVDVLLHEDLRVEVGDLRPGDHQRLAARPTRGRRRASRWRPPSGTPAGRRAGPRPRAALAARARLRRRRPRAAAASRGGRSRGCPAPASSAAPGR